MNRWTLFLVGALLGASWSGISEAQTPANTSSSQDLQQTYQDIEDHLGMVPSFLKSFPSAGLAAAWEEMKSISLNPDTAIPGKYKELIGLAVASQIPCDYCVYFHTGAAKMGGGVDQEVSEAIALAAITRHWSTVLNGNQIDPVQFRAETDAMFKFMKERTDTGQMAPAAITDAETAYKDMEQTFGKVPTFMRRFPAAGIAAAWKEMKAIPMNPDTAIPGKYKELIGLAVASQIPCDYCVYFHTEAAQVNGATMEQVSEAIAVAAITRHWSTVLNGSQIDHVAFQKETDKIFEFVEKKMETASQ